MLLPVDTKKIIEIDSVTYAPKTTNEFNEWLIENNIHDFRFHYDQFRPLTIMFAEEEQLCRFILKWCC